MLEVLPQIIVNIFIVGSIYMVAALGYNLSYAIGKFIDMAYASAAIIAFYIAIACEEAGVSMAYAIPLSIITAALFGYCIERFIYRSLRKRKASTLVHFLASLGIFFVVQELVAITFTSKFRILELESRAQVYEIFGSAITDLQIGIFIIGVILFAAIVVIMKRTRIGKAVVAISDDLEVSKMVGMNVDKFTCYVYAASYGIAGVFGLLTGFDVGMEPSSGILLTVEAIIPAIIGGIGSIPGGVIGAFLLSTVENIGIWHLSGSWRGTVSTSLLLIFLLFLPRGFFGAAHKSN